VKPATRLALAPLAALLVGACAEVPERVVLQPAAENVDIAPDAPSETAYKLLGKVESEAAATRLEDAETAARNDLRNKAAALGATVVSIDRDLGSPVPLSDKVRVKLVGRAYKPLE
jgi:hypothetical protein